MLVQNTIFEVDFLEKWYFYFSKNTLIGKPIHHSSSSNRNWIGISERTHKKIIHLLRKMHMLVLNADERTNNSYTHRKARWNGSASRVYVGHMSSYPIMCWLPSCDEPLRSYEPVHVSHKGQCSINVF